MLKKIIGYLLMTIFSALLIVSCQKNEKISQSSTTKGTLQKISLPSDTVEPGIFHNAILAEYDSIYGIEFAADSLDSMDASEVIEIYERVAQIAKDNGDFISTANVHDWAALEVADMISAGYFDANGHLKPINETNALLIAASTSNTSVLTALTNIANYSNNYEDLVPYIETEFGACTGLTTQEEDLLDGYKNVAGHYDFLGS